MGELWYTIRMPQYRGTREIASERKVLMMKKMLALLLCCGMMFTLFGCKSGRTDPTAPETEAPTQTVTEPEPTELETLPTEPAEPELLMPSVFLPVQETEIQAEDGTVVLRHSYQELHITLEDAAAAEAIETAYREKLNNSFQDVTDYTDDARELYQSQGPEYWFSFFVDVKYTVERLDEDLLSMRGAYQTYFGGPHPNTALTNMTFDLTTGKLLTLADMLVEDAPVDTLVDMLVEALMETDNAAGLYPEFRDTVADVVSRKDTLTHYWYLGGEGLWFTFSAYDLAPYAAGPYVVCLPYEKLDGLLKPQFFPTERGATGGTLTAIRTSEEGPGLLARLTEVVLSEDGEQFLLTANGTLYDVSIEQPRYGSDGVYYGTECTLFATAELHPGDAIRVSHMFVDVLPNLQVSYSDGGTRTTVALFQSGEDGSILVIEP